MSIKERIMTIRLCEKIEKYPQFAKSLGIEYSGVAEPPCPVKIEPHRPLNRATMSSGESQYIHNN